MAALIKSQERARGKPPRIIPVHSVKRLAPAKKKKKANYAGVTLTNIF